MKAIRLFGKIKSPQNPTMAESFGTKIASDDLEKFMNPLGFIEEKDKSAYSNENDQKNEDQGQELGFKIKGPEPTRYGDWERKGRCTDF